MFYYALYNYFDQMDEEDENGWCRGVLNGEEGLYPGSYVQRT